MSYLNPTEIPAKYPISKILRKDGPLYVDWQSVNGEIKGNPHPRKFPVRETSRSDVE